MELLAQRLHVRGFIEGIEIPIISCVVQANINSPAVASISIVPLDEVKKLGKRSLVHLFFYDYALNEVVNFDDMQKYKLLFTGETSGISVMDSPLGRSCVLQCVDLSTNWDLCYQYMITYGPNGNFITESSANWAGENAVFNNIVDGHAQVLSRYLERTPKTIGLQNIKGLLGGIISLVEALGGVANHRVGVNDYFSISEFKNKTMQQIVAEQDDNTAQRLFESKEFYQWLEGGVSSLGELCTIRDMIRMLFNYIYYEVIPITSPYYIPGDAQANTTPEEIESELIENQLEVTISELRALLDNVLTPNYSLQGEIANIIEELTKVTGPNSVLKPTKQQSKELTKANVFLDHAQNTFKNPSRKNPKKDLTLIQKNIKSAIAAIEAAIKLKPQKKLKDIKVDRLNSFIFRPECYFVSPPRCSVIFPEHETQLSYEQNYLSEVTRLRLQSSMIFGIDNDPVLTSYSYAPAMKEIQELAKKQGTRGIRALLPWEKFTGIRPKFERTHEIDYIANKKQRELQKNIVGQAVSYKQKAANFNFFKHRFGARSMVVNMKFNPFIACGFPALVINRPFIINRQLAKDILNQGGGNVTLESLTQDFLVKNIEELAEKLPAPTQYLGMVQTLTHSLDSTSGGTTMVNLSHARTHEITEDDFLISFQEQRSKEAELILKSTFLDADELSKNGDAKLLQFLIDATPQDAYTTKKKKKKAPLTSVVERPKLKVDGLDINLPRFTPAAPDEPAPAGFEGEALLQELEDKSILVPAKYEKVKPGSKGPLGGTIKMIQLMSTEIVKVPVNLGSIKTSKGKKITPQKEKLAWRQAIIYEEVNSGRKIKKIPIEEVLRPNWFSPWYSNLYIGDKIYKPFFGTGAIVDQTVFQSPEGLSIQGVGAERNQVMDILTESKDLTTDIKNMTQSKLFDIPSVETAANILAFQYGEIKRLGLDANRFINDYTYRPIASLIDMFGTSDLEYAQVENKLVLKSGTPGFHSTAIADYGDLLGIVDNPDIEYPMGNQKGKVKISKLLDPRPERRKRVLDYVSKLKDDGGEVVGLRG